MKDALLTAYTIAIGCCFILAVMGWMGDNGAGTKICSLMLGTLCVIAWRRIAPKIEENNDTDNW